MFLNKSVPGGAFLSLTFVFLLSVSGCAPSADKQTNKSAEPNLAASSSPQPVNSSPKKKLNVNTASGAEFLAAIPGMGNKMVHEFEEYRPYKSIQQFRKEIGKYVDQNQVAEYEKYIFVPVNETDSDAPTLQQIPGLDANEAQELIAGRPYASRDAFLKKLAEKISAEELETAKGYLTQP